MKLCLGQGHRLSNGLTNLQSSNRLGVSFCLIEASINTIMGIRMRTLPYGLTALAGVTYE